METKKQINERKLQEMSDAISTPYGRMKLFVAHWMPMGERRIMPMSITNNRQETEEERVERLYCAILRQWEQFDRDEKAKELRAERKMRRFDKSD